MCVVFNRCPIYTPAFLGFETDLSNSVQLKNKLIYHDRAHGLHPASLSIMKQVKKVGDMGWERKGWRINKK